MTDVYFDNRIDDDRRRKLLYRGGVFVYSPTENSRQLCALAREMAVEAFAPHDPREAQHALSVQQFIEILTDLKPKFIHDPRAKKLIPGVLGELGCNLDNTYFDVPRLRTSTSDQYLTSGIAYAFKPHRDTWYSTPLCQLNWWLPVYDIEPENTMAFHPIYWDRPIKNSSRDFNYQEWQSGGRKTAASHVGKDTRKQSEAEEPVILEPDLRIVAEPASIMIFSAAQMHSSVTNTSGLTRWSIDFRTVNVDELRDNSGAPNIDGKSSGTTIQDYLRGTDLSHVPDDIAANFE